MGFQIVVVGTSLGGFHALKTILGGLPKDFPLPVVVAQHRSIEESELFVPLLASHVPLPVIEINDKQELLEGRIFVGPANYHILIDGSHLALSTEGPVLYARPSIDVLFESAAESFGEGVLGILLTGMSRDGTAGLKRIRERSGFTVVQDPSTAEGRIMPETAIESAVADKVLPLEKIAPYLLDLAVGQKVKA
jgi:two-component system, chemotaxis family, protein-glutamate methylesterase/glutaminase